MGRQHLSPVPGSRSAFFFQWGGPRKASTLRRELHLDNAYDEMPVQVQVRLPEPLVTALVKRAGGSRRRCRRGSGHWRSRRLGGPMFRLAIGRRRLGAGRRRGGSGPAVPRRSRRVGPGFGKPVGVEQQGVAGRQREDAARYRRRSRSTPSGGPVVLEFFDGSGGAADEARLVAAGGVSDPGRSRRRRRRQTR